MMPFHVEFRPGATIYEQIVYAAKKAMMAGQLRPGDAFPSVHTLSRELKINPNTAHKVITHLVQSGLLEIRPGAGTLVANRPQASPAEKTQLLEEQVEQLAVESKRLGIDFEDLQEAVCQHWKRLKPRGTERTSRARRPPSMTAVIRTEELTKRYRGLRALDRVNLEVLEGAIYALVGPNGAGKTTSIKILMNLISATSGHAAVLGVDSTLIRGKSYTEIGYVSENQEIPGWMRVGALLQYLRDFYPTWDRELEDSLLKQFDLPRDRKIRALSRGMKMKLALAGALAFHPKLIVLDEPFGGLDPLVRDQLIEGLLERAAESTVFISSHDLAEIESFASHVGYLEQGTLRFSEERTALAARFREVEITCEGESRVPSPVPASWLQLKSSAGVLRFVENQFAEDKTTAEIRRLLGEVKDVEYRPMGLRAIFLAMARKGHEA